MSTERLVFGMHMHSRQLNHPVKCQLHMGFVAAARPRLVAIIFETVREKKLSSTNVLDLFFKDDSAVSGIDSGGEGVDICAYLGTALNLLDSRKEAHLMDIFAEFVLDIMLHSFCLLDSRFNSSNTNVYLN